MGDDWWKVARSVLPLVTRWDGGLSWGVKLEKLMDPDLGMQLDYG